MRTFWGICRWILAIGVGAVLAVVGSNFIIALLGRVLLSFMNLTRVISLPLFLLGLQLLSGMFFGGALGATAAVTAAQLWWLRERGEGAA